jgi:hypothetical protein
MRSWDQIVSMPGPKIMNGDSTIVTWLRFPVVRFILNGVASMRVGQISDLWFLFEVSVPLPWISRFCAGWAVACLVSLASGQQCNRGDWDNGDWAAVLASPANLESTEENSLGEGELLVVDRNASIPIPDTERPSPRAIDSPNPLSPSTLEATASELDELSQWVRWIALKNLPPNLEDNRKWGRQKKVYDGVDWKWDGIRLDTKRRWKMVNHGTWFRYFVEFIDPAQKMEIRVLSLESRNQGKGFASRIRIVAPLKIFARASQFQRDIQIVSVSIQADAKVALDADLEVGIRVNPLVFPPEVQFLPKATRAEVQLLEWQLHRLSQIHGDPAEWLGEGIRGILERKLSDYNDQLVQKINNTLEKQSDRLKLSAQKWFSSSTQRSIQR